MNDFVKVAGHDGLVRDMSSHAIVNTNKADYENYIARRNAAMATVDQLERHEREIASIREDLSDIKGLLLKLLENKNGG